MVMEKSLVSRIEVVPFGKSYSKDYTPPGVRRDLRPYQDKGNQIKASYSASGTSNPNLESVFPGMWLGDSFRSFETNGHYRKSSSGTSHILDARDDEYGGVIVDSERLPHDVHNFGSILHASLRHWRSEGKRGIWLKLPIERSDLVPIAVKEGFKYHHAEQDYVMLTYWIPNEPNLLPSNASHQVGVGGFVVSDKNEVLVVQEKCCTLACTDVWKLPTGFINEAEEIFDGVVREVKEETGVDTEFLEVIAFRHAHSVAFKKSDLFFVCMLRPLSAQIKVDGTEIRAAKWMPLSEFMEQPFINGDDMFMKIIDICIARRENLYCGLEAHGMVSKFDGKYSSLYYNVYEAQENCQADGKHTS